ncbi:2-oxoisovalerate dehydrogenase subunit beta [Rubrobacter xylanophilus DSM 9941]|uniref:alpha-ketoacid dehydrogenase subunit beta n=1 Tax=Rubrobacter xylanophilus TaxID=49319 RepID=UPI001C642C34|nr:alpha-ketoacid dehydrogenase subunit beta [Rubrobacter xylanophilus]QYJ16598.1 2-oxoisovalerate dehydrogenase subunit beta [Rubrobacter xylanophilus DSM 9941]
MPRTISYTEALREALDEELGRDETTFFMGEDVGAFGGIFGEAAGLQQKYGKKRVFDTPISETFIVGGGVGAAITGLRPIVELQFADFVSVAMDEIYNKAAKWRYMHGGLFKVPLVIVAPEGAMGGAGPEHSQCPEALFWSAAGLYVLTPATPADAKGLLKSAIRDDNPVLFLPHKALGNTTGEVPDGEHLVPLGQAAIRRRGDDVTLVAWSAMVLKALEAADRLADEGIDVEVIDPRGIRPFDFDAVLESVEKTGRVVLAHEAPVPGGPGSEIAAVIAERAIASLEAPVKRVGAPDVPVPQSAHLERFVVPQTEDIVDAVREVAGSTVTA